MVLLSITGLFRTVLIIVGILVILRLIGRLMIAKRNLDVEKEHLRRQRESEKMMQNARQDHGKISIGRIDKKKADQAGYTDFEEIN